MLAKALTNLLTPKAEKIETTQDLRTKCLDKPICGLLLKGSKQSPNYIKDAMSKLVTEHPAVTFGAIDSSNLYVKGLEAEYLDEFQQDKPRFVVFKKVSGSTSASGSSDKNKKDTGRLKTSLVTLDDDVSVGYGPMSNLVASVVTSKANMQKVPALPTVKTRTKKLVEEERKKRQRRTEQKDRASGGGGGSGGAFSGENDGSAEGRRAERERRREEHRRKNNVKPKTPEEIAEMERRRRQRMEEESAKWNVADEDLGDLLDDVGDGSDSVDWDVDDDENDADGGGSGGGDDEDDEDVMDLD